MSVFPRQPVTDRSAWRGSQLRHERSWIVELTPSQAAELERESLEGTEVARVIDAARDEVVRGRGFVLLRGLPVQGREMERVRAMYWRLGERLGKAVVQNLDGDLIAEIRDRGQDVNALNVKPSNTNAEQRPHTDPGDIVALLCIRRARAGGLSRIASTMAIYNELLATHPRYLDWLYRGFHHDLRGDATPEAPFGCTPKPIPVYRWYEGRLSCVFNASTIKDAQRRMGSRVPEAEMAAIDAMVELAKSDEFRLDMDFQPGDLQLVNNYTVMHWRTQFEDGEAPEHRRLLLRLWIAAPDIRAIDPEMAAGYITGARTGGERLGTAAHA